MLFVFPARAERGDRRRGDGRRVAGWSALTCYWGVRQRCLSWELELYYPLIQRSGGLEGKMWRAEEGSELDQAKIARGKGGGGREMTAMGEKSGRTSFQQLPSSPGLHINELGCPLWAKRGKSLLSMEPANIRSHWGLADISLAVQLQEMILISSCKPKWVLELAQVFKGVLLGLVFLLCPYRHLQ